MNFTCSSISHTHIQNRSLILNMLMYAGKIQAKFVEKREKKMSSKKKIRYMITPNPVY